MHMQICRLYLASCSYITYMKEWIQVEWQNKRQRSKTEVIEEQRNRPSNKAHPLCTFVPWRIFQQYCYCNITPITHTLPYRHTVHRYAHKHAHSIPIAPPLSLSLSHTRIHTQFKRLNRWTFDLLKNEWASEMRWEAIGDGYKRCVREKGLRAKVVAREMVRGEDKS